MLAAALRGSIGEVARVCRDARNHCGRVKGTIKIWGAKKGDQAETKGQVRLSEAEVHERTPFAPCNTWHYRPSRVQQKTLILHKSGH